MIDMAQHEYKCQSCFHRGVCPEYHPETYICVHHIDKADVAPRAEVAREIFEEIDSLIYKWHSDSLYSTGELLYDVSELKKKCTEENEA